MIPLEYIIQKQNLFDKEIVDNYYLVHCISADFALGAGIAVEFNKLFNIKNKLQTLYPNYKFDKYDCILIDKVFNLVTKDKCWHKPTYGSMLNALIKLKKLCKDNNVTKLAMPIIGCGLDRLEWDKVEELIKQIFKDTEIEIRVCVL